MTMVPLTSLGLPILVGAVLVFVASSLMHMVLGYHASDWRKVPAQDAVQDALRPFALQPGDYMLPRPDSMADMNTPAFKEKRDKGPVLVMTVFPSGQSGMGKQLALWFLYAIVVGKFAGYVAGITLAPGAPYMTVFRITGTVAFAGYALALLQQSIWYQRSWKTTLISVFDGLIYALLTAGAFGWLWPA
jgi:Flp pilus assembly protein TadB